MKSNQWLTVVGVDSKTRVQLQIKDNHGKPDFNLTSDDRQNKWTDGSTPQEKEQTGDGTVPFAGAIPKFLEKRNLVLVTPDDFGYWEIGDRVLIDVAGFHSMMPKMNMLHRLIVRFLADKPDVHKNTWGLPAPGITNKEWKPPLDLDVREKIVYKDDKDKDEYDV
jgi:hypothetical protein